MKVVNSLKLRVLFFGATADTAGTRATDLEMPPGSTSREAFDRVLDVYPKLSAHKLIYSLNQEYANGDESLATGDELAVFTAVSGG